MAQRFGGKYSPTPNGSDSPQSLAPRATPQAAHQKPAGQWRTTILFLSAFCFIFPAFGDKPSAMLLGLISGGLLIASAWLSRDGLKARAAFNERRVARRPAIPRLLFGAILTGLALMIGGAIAHGISIYPLLFGLMGAGFHMGTFGLDPWSDKGMEGIDTFQTDRVARAIAEADTTLRQMKDAILRTNDRKLEARVDQFTAQARQLMRRVEEDPSDLTAARKYLSVYLQGAKDATVKFSDLWLSNRDMKARQDYELLLADLENTFAQRSVALLSNDRNNLDIEIEVLRDRLKFETPK